VRILVASAFEASSPRAHAINTVKMAEGFARLGHQVTLVCKRSAVGKHKPSELAEFYGMTKRIKWVQLPHEVLNREVGLHWMFAFFAMLVALRVRPKLIFARNYIFPWSSSLVGFMTVAESHAHPDNNSAPFLRLVEASHHRNFVLWVTISRRLADHYCSLGVPANKIAVLPDAVDLNLFTRSNAIPASPYTGGRPVVTYVGHLYDYKGIPTILKTAELLPEVQFHLVGGLPEDILRHRKHIEKLRLGNVTLHGWRSHGEIAHYLWHADVLLLPPSANHPSAAWTSPVKLGEYLASGTPVVATAIPALRDWLTENEAKFVEPDNAESMGKGIMEILEHPEYGMRLAKKGFEKAQGLSYERRAQSILERLTL
jgi:glycosyltransferase involved in cell wall biosynthesis